MPKVTKEHSEARRQQIVDAAYRCFAREGLQQTTMRHIYEEAGLSAGAVYHYFASKVEIIESSFAYDYRRSADVFAAAESSPNPGEALGDLIEFFFRGIEEAAAIGAGRVNVQGWGEALTNPRLLDSLRALLASYTESLARIIRRAQESGAVSPAVDPDAAGQTLLSLYYGLELQKAVNPDVDVDRYTRAARALLGLDARHE